jgi:hypothetical protein
MGYRFSRVKPISERLAVQAHTHATTSELDGATGAGSHRAPRTFSDPPHTHIYTQAPRIATQFWLAVPVNVSAQAVFCDMLSNWTVLDMVYRVGFTKVNVCSIVLLWVTYH